MRVSTNRGLNTDAPATNHSRNLSCPELVNGSIYTSAKSQSPTVASAGSVYFRSAKKKFSLRKNKEPQQLRDEINALQDVKNASSDEGGNTANGAKITTSDPFDENRSCPIPSGRNSRRENDARGPSTKSLSGLQSCPGRPYGKNRASTKPRPSFASVGDEIECDTSKVFPKQEGTTASGAKIMTRDPSDENKSCPVLPGRDARRENVARGGSGARSSGLRSCPGRPDGKNRASAETRLLSPTGVVDGIDSDDTSKVVPEMLHLTCEKSNAYESSVTFEYEENSQTTGSYSSDDARTRPINGAESRGTIETINESSAGSKSDSCHDWSMDTNSITEARQDAVKGRKLNCFTLDDLERTLDDYYDSNTDTSDSFRDWSIFTRSIVATCRETANSLKQNGFDTLEDFHESGDDEAESFCGWSIFTENSGKARRPKTIDGRGRTGGSIALDSSYDTSTKSETSRERSNSSENSFNVKRREGVKNDRQLNNSTNTLGNFYDGSASGKNSPGSITFAPRTNATSQTINTNPNYDSSASSKSYRGSSICTKNSTAKGRETVSFCKGTAGIGGFRSGGIYTGSIDAMNQDTDTSDSHSLDNAYSVSSPGTMGASDGDTFDERGGSIWLAPESNYCSNLLDGLHLYRSSTDGKSSHGSGIFADSIELIVADETHSQERGDIGNFCIGADAVETAALLPILNMYFSGAVGQTGSTEGVLQAQETRNERPEEAEAGFEVLRLGRVHLVLYSNDARNDSGDDHSTAECSGANALAMLESHEYRGLQRAFRRHFASLVARGESWPPSSVEFLSDAKEFCLVRLNQCKKYFR